MDPFAIIGLLILAAAGVVASKVSYDAGYRNGREVRAYRISLFGDDGGLRVSSGAGWTSGRLTTSTTTYAAGDQVGSQFTFANADHPPVSQWPPPARKDQSILDLLHLFLGDPTKGPAK